jgi:hypothetical protein
MVVSLLVAVLARRHNSESDGMGEILAPLLQIIPELNELCGEPSVVVVVVVVSTTPLQPPFEPCQTLAHVDSAGLDASDSSRPWTLGMWCL